MKVQITNYGAIITKLVVPDKNGVPTDVVLGFNKLSDYETFSSPYIGAVVGRYGNRIANGKFTLNDKEYELAKNNSPGGVDCHLHGGNKGFDK